MSELNEEACGFLLGWFLGSLFVFLFSNFIVAWLIHALFPSVPLLFAFGILVFGTLVGTLLKR